MYFYLFFFSNQLLFHFLKLYYFTKNYFTYFLLNAIKTGRCV